MSIMQLCVKVPGRFAKSIHADTIRNCSTEADRL